MRKARAFGKRMEVMERTKAWSKRPLGRFSSISPTFLPVPGRGAYRAMQACVPDGHLAFSCIAGEIHNMERTAEAAPADLEGAADRFEVIKAKIESNPELRDDEAIQAKLARISGKFERLAAAEEKEEIEEAEEAAPADLEGAADRFDAIKAKIESNPELRKDKAIRAQLARISGKFERLAGAEEKEETEEAEEAGQEEQEVADPASNALMPQGLDQPEGLERVQKRFEAIKAKINKSNLKSNPSIKASLRRISRKFKDLEKDAEEEA